MNRHHSTRVHDALFFASAATRRSRVLLGVVVVAAFGFAGCGQGLESNPADEAGSSDTSEQALSPAASTAQVSVDNGGLSPQQLSEAASVTPQSVSMPCGSYIRTCWNLVIGDNYFAATCRTKAGGSRRSSITRAQCPKWALWNDNGVLRCASGC